MKTLVFLLLVSISSYAQKNSIYVEFTTTIIIGGSMSINYERQLFENPKLLIRGGLGFYGGCGFGGCESIFTIPTSINYLVTISDDKFIDIGTGPHLIKSGFDSPDAPKNIIFLSTNLGYRQYFGNNFFWRAHISPYNIYLTKNKYRSGNGLYYSEEIFDIPRTWIGFSIGKRF